MANRLEELREHHPAPWRLDGEALMVAIVDAENKCVMHRVLNSDEDASDYELIVHLWNALAAKGDSIAPIPPQH